mgnify:CR=1 FL=1
MPKQQQNCLLTSQSDLPAPKLEAKAAAKAAADSDDDSDDEPAPKPKTKTACTVSASLNDSGNAEEVRESWVCSARSWSSQKYGIEIDTFACGGF